MSRYLQTLAKKIRPILLKYRVKQCAVFGSVARGEATKFSDLDLLIDPAARMTLFDLSGLQQELVARIDGPVDVVTRRSLHPLLKKNIMRDAVTIYEAN